MKNDSFPQNRRTFLDNEDIRCVTSPYPNSSTGIITTPVLSAEMKHVLLERLEKEIVSKLGGSISRVGTSKIATLSGQRRRRDRQGGKPSLESDAAKTKKNENEEKVNVPMDMAEYVVRSRFVVGINQCTRILERQFQQQSKPQYPPGSNPNPTPSLLLLARDVRPSTIIAHLSLYANRLNIPTLILPGRASVELGKAVGIRSVAAALFLSSHHNEKDASILDDKQRQREWKEAQNDVDSFVKYVISKIPKEK